MIKKPNRLAYLLNTGLDRLIYLSENVTDYYYEKIEEKRNIDGSVRIKNGKIQYRVLNPSRGELKQVQFLIQTKILSKINFPNHIQGGVKKRDNITNAKRHQGKKFHFCTDIENFFPSINHKMVYSMFIQQSFSPDVSSILTKLTTYKGYLPQGTHTSPYIANLVFLPIDADINKYCLDNSIHYTRFIDDLSFSSSTDFKSNSLELINIIKNGEFKYNSKKTHYKVGPTLITGIWAKNNSLKARDDQIAKLESDILDYDQMKGLSQYVQRVENF